MQPIRDIKRRARRDLHTRALIPALYIASPGAAPVVCNVRVHTSFGQTGDLIGGELTNSSYAEREDVKPKIIFDALEVPAPVRLGVVSVAAGEAYRVAFVKPRDGEFIPAMVTLLSASEAAGLPVPSIA